MNDVDQELFLEMLLKLDGSHDSIKAASKWCRANAEFHEEIVRMWFFAVAKARTMVRRLDLFHLASDILFTAEPQSLNYFSSFLPQLVKAISLVRGEEIKLSMKKLFALWREKNIYNKPVMDRLDKMLRNRNRVVDKNYFRYDRDLLFKNLHRITELRPACDYLNRSMDNSPSFDDSQRMLGMIKERRSCNSLLNVVDNHKAQVTSLVTHLEEMVHLLKMTTVALDIAANREQNGIEETKLKMVAYGRFSEKVLSLLHRLESNYNIPKKVKAIPMTPASPEPEEVSLFSRRDASFADSPASPLVTPCWNPPGPVGFKVGEPEIFHRRDTFRGAPRAPYSGRSSLTGDVPMTPTRDPFPSNIGSMTPTRDPFPSNIGSMTPTRDPFPSKVGSMTPTRDEFATSLTPADPWYPASPSYSGASTWGSGQSSNTRPVYQKWFTGIQDMECASPRPLSGPSSSSLPALMSIPFTTFMGPSSSGYQKK